MAGPSSSGPPSSQQTPVATTVSMNSLPALNLRTVVRPAQTVDSAALFSGTPPTRPPYRSPITPAVNHNVGSGLSAPPHLRHFTPPSMVASQTIPSNPPMSSPLVPRHPSQTPQPAYTPQLQNRPQIGNPSGVVPHFPTISLSPVELRADVSIRPVANPIAPSNLTPQSVANPIAPSSLTPQSGLLPSAQPDEQSSVPPNPVQNNVANDIVCLSDDE